MTSHILAFCVGAIAAFPVGFMFHHMLSKPEHVPPSRLSEEDAARRVG